MIPAIAIIVSAYAVARLFCIVVDQKHFIAHNLRGVVSAAAILVIIWQCLDVVNIASKFASRYPGLVK